MCNFQHVKFDEKISFVYYVVVKANKKVTQDLYAEDLERYLHCKCWVFGLRDDRMGVNE